MKQFDFWFWLVATVIDGISLAGVVPTMNAGEIAYRMMWFGVCAVAFVRAYNALYGA